MHHEPTATNEIVLITRLRTPNQGNQALSIAWRDLLTETFAPAPIRLIERAPRYLRRYPFRLFARSADPVALFERIAQRLVRMAAPPAQRPQPHNDVAYDHRMMIPRRFLALRQALNPRRMLTWLGFYRREFADRMALLRDALLVVVNPAGEFQADATDQALAYLFDLRCAQLFGVPNAVVNLTFEPQNPVVRQLALHVFEQADYREFREEPSLALYRASGGTRPIRVLPDAALTIAGPTAQPHAPRQAARIGLVVNGPKSAAPGLMAGWQSLAGGLKADGAEPVLLSNEWSTDWPYVQPLIATGGYRHLGLEAGHDDYMEILTGLDLLVSNRLHSCILAVAAGVPVVPLEAGTVKLTGFFTQIGLPDLVLPMASGTDWVAATRTRIAEILADRDAAIARFAEARAREAARIRETLGADLAALIEARIPNA